MPYQPIILYAEDINEQYVQASAVGRYPLVSGEHLQKPIS